MNKILNFHLVNDGVWFENLVCYLKSKYKFIPLEILYEFYQGRVELKNVCHITVDDGNKAFYNVIFPVLKKHKVPASIYISPKICMEETNYWFQEIDGCNQLELKRIIADMTGIPLKYLVKYNSESILKTMRINQIIETIKRYRKMTKTPKKSFQNMSINNIREVYQSGLVKIGAHTMNHPVLKNEDDATSRYEINESINELSNLLHQEIKHFSYPNGTPGLDFSEREKIYLIKSGIQLVFSTESKNFLPYDDRTCIPRFGISNGENMSFFKTKMYLGSNWETITRLKPTGEYKQRQNLIRIFSSNKQT
jgi:peptidoglycan/xylan/chitin deacetylase (PgdA/CDA1 family)